MRGFLVSCCFQLAIPEPSASDFVRLLRLRKLLPVDSFYRFSRRKQTIYHWQKKKKKRKQKKEKHSSIGISSSCSRIIVKLPEHMLLSSTNELLNLGRTEIVWLKCILFWMNFIFISDIIQSNKNKSNWNSRYFSAFTTFTNEVPIAELNYLLLTQWAE